MATTAESAPVASAARCANCDQPLSGPFCSACGQEARDLHRPIHVLIGESLGDIFDVDHRLARTVGPLLLKPGEVTRRYRHGHRVAYVPPLRTYLVAALVFFGLFTFFPRDTSREGVFMQNSPEAAARSGGGVSVSLPERLPVFDGRYQEMAARARANPQAFFTAFYAAIPRVFFVLLPLFALYLELFYRKDGFYIDHLVFSLYYHAFVFAMLTILFLVSRTGAWTPWWLRAAAVLSGGVWIVAHLPLALQRVYGGPRWKTGLKLIGLSLLYLLTAVTIGQMLAFYMAMSSL
jgi:hypothetical protein